MLGQHSNSSRVCIFCEENIHRLSEEHIFPASIGGAFIIKTVCSKCNEILGRTVDAPFSRHPMVSWYRNVFQLKRKGAGDRSIPNPAKGRHKGKNGEYYYVTFDNGIPKTNVIRYDDPPIIVGTELIGKSTVSMKDFTSEEQIRKDYAKKFNIDPSLIQLKSIEKSSSDPLTITILSNNSDFILEALKIACEFSVTFFPEYMKDQLFIIFRNILLTKNFDSHLELFNIDSIAGQTISRIIESNKKLPLHWHIATWITIPKKGFYCVVKIFDWIYTFRMSDNENYLKINTTILLINDALLKSWAVTLPGKLTHFIVFFKEDGMSEEQVNFLQACDRSDFANFKDEKGNIPIYDKKGKKLFEDINNLAKDIIFDLSCFNNKTEEIKTRHHYDADKYFIRSTKSSVLLPIEEIEYIYKLNN